MLYLRTEQRKQARERAEERKRRVNDRKAISKDLGSDPPQAFSPQEKRRMKRISHEYVRF
jgi:hypothetical protein